MYNNRHNFILIHNNYSFVYGISKIVHTYAIYIKQKKLCRSLQFFYLNTHLYMQT